MRYASTRFRLSVCVLNICWSFRNKNNKLRLCRTDVTVIANRVLTGCHGQWTIGQYLKVANRSSAQIKLGVGMYESMVSSIMTWFPNRITINYYTVYDEISAVWVTIKKVVGEAHNLLVYAICMCVCSRLLANNAWIDIPPYKCLTDSILVCCHISKLLCDACRPCHSIWSTVRWNFTKFYTLFVLTKIPICGDVAISLQTTMTELITLSLAHMCGITYIYAW